MTGEEEKESHMENCKARWGGSAGVQHEVVLFTNHERYPRNCAFMYHNTELYLHQATEKDYNLYMQSVTISILNLHL